MKLGRGDEEKAVEAEIHYQGGAARVWFVDASELHGLEVLLMVLSSVVLEN